ncbi:DEAD/DEAH box helicase [Flavobacterium sp.]|uniref:DEAD/DEAH box helicase n=1 Tax=Flavobacterium sp. TaxID=239 RepID=UPI002623A11A|nr:DEAD/DEAH box helicase [Flavobacterium sp.]
MSKIVSLEKRQLGTLKNNEYFIQCFRKLILSQKLDSEESQYLLSSAIIFFRYYDNDRRYKGYFNIAYYMILKYSLLNNDYKPLYDISLQIGFYPISDFILKNNFLNEETLHEAIINLEINKRYAKENYVETIEQFNRSNDIYNQIKEHDTAYIAPTSFGKSSIIRDVITKNNFSKIAIIVPTKSLIVQTYNDIRKLNLNYKLILHDEMYNNENNFIGILTQERATRLINKHKITFDILFIDEAHNLLNNNSRNHLLSRLIMLNHRKNEKQRLLFLSPLVADVSNLKIKYTSNNEILESSIQHNLKAFEINHLDKKGKVFTYNRYTDEYYNLASNISFTEYIKRTSKEKNFIYHYRPKFVEKIAANISELSDIEPTENLTKISKIISNEVSEDIDIVEYVLKGVIYLHGKLPNILKEYLEYCYKEYPEFKYVIANSVILEGINFPISTLYICSTFGLGAKDLNNLIGRVNRLNYVFNQSLNRLISKIHFTDTEEFADNRSNMVNKISLLREHTFTDEAKNPLLENYDIEQLKLSGEEKIKRKNKDDKIIDSTQFMLDVDPQDIAQRIKLNLIQNNIDDFYKDIEITILTISQKIKKLENKNLIDIIYEIFVQDLESNLKDFEIERLKNEKARNYYNNYLNIFQLLSLKEKITSTISYFETKAKNDEDTFLYIGNSFGEISLSSTIYEDNEYRQEVYINLKGKSKQQLANIALVKIKLEEDFVSFKLKKLITFLYDFAIISEDMYNLAVYGSTNVELINLTRIGLNPNIIRVIQQYDQTKNISFDSNGNLVSNNEFRNFISSQSELFKFEVDKYVR